MILPLCNPKPDWAVQMFASLASVVRPVFLVAWLVANFVAVPHLAFAQVDPLPSWNDGSVKTSIIDFVARVTKQGGGDFVPVVQRIATLDNAGTLWCEQPYYSQVAFALDRVKALAPKHPEWQTQQPFKALLEKDMKTFAAAGF
jgi:hypothetical protein